MKRNHYYLSIWLAVFVVLAVSALVVFAPGFWEYQQIRWRTKITPEQIEAGMTGMFTATKATEEILGHGNVTAQDLQIVSAELFREMRRMSEHNDLAMALRVRYLHRLQNDPTGADLKATLYDEIIADVSERIDENSQLNDSLRICAYDFAISDPLFEEILLEKIGSIDRLRISDEQAEMIKGDQSAAPQSTNNSESESESGDKPKPESEGHPQ